VERKGQKKVTALAGKGQKLRVKGGTKLRQFEGKCELKKKRQEGKVGRGKKCVECERNPSGDNEGSNYLTIRRKDKLEN